MIILIIGFVVVAWAKMQEMPVNILWSLAYASGLG